MSNFNIDLNLTIVNITHFGYYCNMPTLTDEHFASLRQIFVSSDIPLVALSSQSEKLIGVSVTLDQLKTRSTAEGWVTERNSQKTSESQKLAKTISSEIDTLRQIIFNAIVAAGKDGVFVLGQDLDPDKVKLAIETAGYNIDGVIQAKPKFNSALVTAYMTVLQKMNFDFGSVGMDRPSAKTVHQQVLEAMNAIAEDNKS